jgi:glycogen debranching enzyme
MLSFVYHGTDDVYRSLEVCFTPPPDDTKERSALFQVKLPPRASQEFEVVLTLRESAQLADVKPHLRCALEWTAAEKATSSSLENWLADQTQVSSDGRFLEEILNRSLRDLRVLRTRLFGEEFFAAGIPWFVTLFGRDSLLAALQSLAFTPKVAEQTLRLLAKYQGTKVDDWRDEQPGKILHELRVGELARRGAIPHTPYYGSIDSTPLFLILLGRLIAWTGNLHVFHDLRENVERALDWLRNMATWKETAISNTRAIPRMVLSIRDGRTLVTPSSMRMEALPEHRSRSLRCRVTPIGLDWK